MTHAADLLLSPGVPATVPLEDMGLDPATGADPALVLDRPAVGVSPEQALDHWREERFHWHRAGEEYVRGLRQLQELRARALADPGSVYDKAQELLWGRKWDDVEQLLERVGCLDELVDLHYSRLIACYERRVAEARRNAWISEAQCRTLALALPLSLIPRRVPSRPPSRGSRPRRRSRGRGKARSPGRPGDDGEPPERSCRALARPAVVLEAGACPPELIVRVPLEGEARIVVAAGSFMDERRPRDWLRRCGVLNDVAAILTRLLDDLDEFDRKNAA